MRVKASLSVMIILNIVNMAISTFMEAGILNIVTLLFNIINIEAIIKEIRLLKTKIVDNKNYTKFFIEDIISNISAYYAFLLVITLYMVANSIVTGGNQTVNIPYISDNVNAYGIISIINVIALVVVLTRYYDIETSYKSNWAEAKRRIPVDKIKDNCLNGRYCKIYMDKVEKFKFSVDEVYDIVYLSGTLGLYVVKAEDVYATMANDISSAIIKAITDKQDEIKQSEIKQSEVE